MANKQMQRCSTHLVNMEMQIQNTVRHYYISTRMAKIQKEKSKKN